MSKNKAVRIREQDDRQVRQARHIQPMTENQGIYLDALKQDNIVVARGPAGTGKTWLAAAYSINALLNDRTIHKIVLTRPAYGPGKEIGFLPGTVEEKMAPWLAPIVGAMIENSSANEIENQKHRKNIEIVPLETIRGNSWDNTIILCDESQNLTMDEIKAITTRIGKGSLLVLMGDTTQRDDLNRRNKASVAPLDIFLGFVEKRNIDRVSVIDFTLDDIVRSDICAEMVKMFYEEGL